MSGWVRGTGRECVAHNAQSPYNWERFQEAHDFVMKAWSDPGPFRWEGEHYHYRYVNPWSAALPAAASARSGSRACCPQHGGVVRPTPLPYVMLATGSSRPRQSFDYYDQVAREHGYEAGPQHRGYLFKVHVDETEELADAGRPQVPRGPAQHLPRGQPGQGEPVLAEPAGHDVAHRPAARPSRSTFAVARRASRDSRARRRSRHASEPAERNEPYETQLEAGDHHRHAEDGPAQDPHTCSRPCARADLLLGRRRRR